MRQQLLAKKRNLAGDIQYVFMLRHVFPLKYAVHQLQHRMDSVQPKSPDQTQARYKTSHWTQAWSGS